MSCPDAHNIMRAFLRMNSATPVQYAALGVVLMEASIALSGLSAVARMCALAVGLGLIVIAAGISSVLMSRTLVIQIALISILCALAFEVLSAFNGHLVFEPKIIVFRVICYLLITSGVLIGSVTSAVRGKFVETAITTAIVLLIVLSASLTSRSLQELVLIEGTRGHFDGSSPVALGFNSGTLAVAALVIALRSINIINYALGIAGFGGWTLICMLSGSRGALLSLALTTLFLLAIGLAAAPKRSIALIALATVVLTGRLVVDSKVAEQAGYIFERFESVLNPEADASIAGSADSRAYVLEHNLNLPGLFFLGAKGFSSETYPHNFEVEALVRLGAPLATILILCVGWLLWKMIQILNGPECGVPLAILFCMGFFTFLNAQTNMMWEFLRPLWLALGVAAGICIGRRCRRPSVDAWLHS